MGEMRFRLDIRIPKRGKPGTLWCAGEQMFLEDVPIRKKTLRKLEKETVDLETKIPGTKNLIEKAMLMKQIIEKRREMNNLYHAQYRIATRLVEASGKALGQKTKHTIIAIDEETPEKIEELKKQITEMEKWRKRTIAKTN